MKDRFISGMIAGGMIGAATGMYVFEKMSPRQRRKMAKRGNRLIKNTANFVDMVQFLR